VGRPEELGVVGLEVVVEVERGNRDPGETHSARIAT